jgi:FlaA1/EpsC-like NDP-sugar epimerase
MSNLIVLENKVITKKNRFPLSVAHKNELKRIFYNQNVLIFGAAGSIGSAFVLNILKYKIKKLYLIDNNENELVELNRHIILADKKTDVEYICNDINNFELNKFIKTNKINIFLNFAAIKHVRSEENIHTLKYLFETNCNNCFNFTPTKYLKKVFFISTDKASDPSSLMGVSKKIMEQKLFLKKKRYKENFFSSVRFANVSFSNGSVLKMIVDKINSNQNFGIPLNIKRFFITHSEAVNLCLKSLTKEADGMILIPNEVTLGKQISIFELLIKILKHYKIKNKIHKNFIITKKFKISLISKKIVGQKNSETLYSDGEFLAIKTLDKSTTLMKPKITISKTKIIKQLTFKKKIIHVKEKLLKYFKGININKENIKLSKNL